MQSASPPVALRNKKAGFPRLFYFVIEEAYIFQLYWIPSEF